MQIQELDSKTLEALDTGNGTFRSLLTMHESYGYDIHLSVQTHLEGLPDGEMKLFIQIVEGTETKDFAIARLVGAEAQIIGWNIYLHDRLSSARVNIGRANLKLDLETLERISVH